MPLLDSDLAKAVQNDNSSFRARSSLSECTARSSNSPDVQTQQDGEFHLVENENPKPLTSKDLKGGKGSKMTGGPTVLLYFYTCILQMVAVVTFLETPSSWSLF